MAALTQSGAIQFTYQSMAFIGAESRWAAESVQCATDQGKFWAYHDQLLANQQGENQGAFAKSKLKGFAKAIGLDEQQFGDCLESGKYTDAVKQSTENAQKAGVQSTPSFTINGKLIPWQTFDDVTKAINEAVKQQ